MRLLFLGIFIAFFSLSCQQITQVESPSRSIASLSEVPSYWKGGTNAFPLNMKIDSAFTSVESTSIHTASQSWEDETKFKSDFFSLESLNEIQTFESTDNYKDEHLGIYKLTKWPWKYQSDNEEDRRKSMALAITQLFGLRKNIGKGNEYIEIYHADILVNYDNFTFKTNESEYGYDLETVILHELGHFLGLYHDTQTKESIMYPSISSSEIKRSPIERDRELLMQKYSVVGYTPQYSLKHKGDSKDDEGEEVVITLQLNPDGLCTHTIH